MTGQSGLAWRGAGARPPQRPRVPELLARPLRLPDGHLDAGRGPGMARPASYGKRRAARPRGGPPVSALPPLFPARRGPGRPLPQAGPPPLHPGGDDPPRPGHGPFGLHGLGAVRARPPLRLSLRGPECHGPARAPELHRGARGEGALPRGHRLELLRLQHEPPRGARRRGLPHRLLRRGGRLPRQRPVLPAHPLGALPPASRPWRGSGTSWGTPWCGGWWA